MQGEEPLTPRPVVALDGIEQGCRRQLIGVAEEKRGRLQDRSGTQQAEDVRLLTESVMAVGADHPHTTMEFLFKLKWAARPPSLLHTFLNLNFY
jgi:hypothetical protein